MYYVYVYAVYIFVCLSSVYLILKIIILMINVFEFDSMGGQLDKCMLHWQPAVYYYSAILSHL